MRMYCILRMRTTLIRQQIKRYLFLIFVIIKLIEGNEALDEEDCGLDSYYDAVDGECVLCIDICQPEKSPRCGNYCQTNCPDHFNRTCITRPKHRDIKTSSTSVSPVYEDTSALALFQTKSAEVIRLPLPVVNPPPSDLLHSPLLWLAVGCLFVTLLVIVIVIFVMFHYISRQPPASTSENPLIPPEYKRSESMRSSLSARCTQCGEIRSDIYLGSGLSNGSKLPDNIDQLHSLR